MTSNDNNHIDDTQTHSPIAWDGDKLNRQAEGKWLCDYLTNKFSIDTAAHNKNFVLNINADWGFGKTYFLNNIKLELEERNHQVVYFDAWKNDFSDKPLLGFIAEINNALESFMSDESSLTEDVKDGFIKRFKKLKGAAAPLMLGFLAKQLVGSSYGQIQEYFDDEDNTETEQEKVSKSSNKALDDVAKTVSSITTKAAELALKEHVTTKDSIEKFKINLKDLVEYINKEADKKLPLFILVDELDRCRPNYAIELLETIKHLFEVEGVYFILATASHQLSHSINAIYGEKFESKRYLNRFFDQEYQLIKPNNHIYCSYLFDKEIKDASKFRIALPTDSYRAAGIDLNLNVIFIGLIAQYTKAGLRDIEQAIKLLQAINLTYTKSFNLFLIVFLIFCKIRHPDIYPQICNLWGNKPWNEDLKQKIQNSFNLDIKFKYPNRDQPAYQRPDPDKLDILELIITIISLDGQKCHEILTTYSESDIAYYIAEDYVNNNNNRVFDFSFYPTVVNQVGQLM
ncbi:MAG: hypothetical protein ACI9OE_002260 [Mariniflexile sp.]|jgi:hypothetical protein